MTTRRRKVVNDSAEKLLLDKVLAPNSDTECEPLPKRRKHIEQIAQYCRAGGELCLLSSTLRGPVLNNPWARKSNNAKFKPVEGDTRKDKTRSRKSSTSKSSTSTAKDSKVDQYFLTGKLSQEKEIVQKKALNLSVPEKGNTIVPDDTTLRDNQLGCRECGSPEPLKAVPRRIDFDQMPPSTAIASQNFPPFTLKVHPRTVEAPKPPNDEHADTNKNQSNSPSSGEIGLFDEPTPGKPFPPNPDLPKPTTCETASIRNLMSIHHLLDDEQPHQTRSRTPSDQGLLDEPTPSLHTPSVPRTIPSSGTVDPKSLTKNQPQSFSPVKSIPSILPSGNHVNISLLSEPDREEHPTKSPRNRTRSPKKGSQTNSEKSPPKPHSPISPPPNTQFMLDQANESFDAIISPPTPSSLLPPVSLQPRVSPKTGFTPFRELNKSPEMSIKMFSVEDSPLTYSPGAFRDEGLWNELQELAMWNLDEEIVKRQKEMMKKNDGEEKSTSQECAVVA